ncbi:MAG TPA: class I SAM-dependent methyltransferase [Casimicrobiaceae bacterium]|nr:class I SAM-dependent methyltransferase [Casimicrobiaceae bacterium]
MAYDREEFYGDILGGLAAWFDSPAIADIAKTVGRFDEPDLGVALNRNQVTSKLWLAGALRASAGSRFGTITVLGGWFGVLGAILLRDPRLTIGKVVSVDIDPRCAAVAESMNATHAREGRFVAQTADMRTLDYPTPSPDRDVAPDVLVNTSCEHIVGFDDWYARLPDRTLLVLQSNDYTRIADHVNCVTDLDHFQRQAPMRELLFCGMQPHKRYRRFMLIGRK